MKSKRLLTESFKETRAHARKWLPIAYAYVIAQWAQDVLPSLAGAFVASLLGVFIFATAITTDWKKRAGSLLVLGLLGFPAAIMWDTVGAMLENTTWMEPIAKLWALPSLFFVCVSLGILYIGAARMLTTEKNLDTSLREAWLAMAKQSRFTFAVFLALTILFFFSYLTYGLGFLVTAPLALVAFVKLSEELFKKENADVTVGVSIQTEI